MSSGKAAPRVTTWWHPGFGRRATPAWKVSVGSYFILFILGWRSARRWLPARAEESCRRRTWCHASSSQIISKFPLGRDAPDAVGFVVQHIAEMAVADRQRQVFIDDIGGVNGPPVTLNPHQVANGFVIGRLLFVFRRQCEAAGDKHDDVAFKDKIVSVREPAESIPDGFRGATAEFEQDRARQLREQFRGVEREVRAFVIGNVGDRKSV